MKGYKRFIFAFVAVLALYIVAELNRAKPIDWTVTLSKEDKNPYGSYVLFHELKDLFPKASIQSFRLPVYDQINNFKDSNTAYLLFGPELKLSKEDVTELLNYAVMGNYVFIASLDLSKTLSDSLHFQLGRRLDLTKEDSISLGFVNPSLQKNGEYHFNQYTLDEYVSKLDTGLTVLLGTNQFKQPDFIKIPYGDGAFFIHANPLCFSNHFMLTRNNAAYTAAALSYIPAGISAVYWDEYYKSGDVGSASPMRYILSNLYLRWSFRIALLTMLIFVLFEMKRRQRMIPVVLPLRNNTLDFVRTVGGVYFNRHDNKNIAVKKIQYLLEYIRSHFYLSTTALDEPFTEALIKKSGIAAPEIKFLVEQVQYVLQDGKVNDSYLLQLNNSIDSFYKKAK